MAGSAADRRTRLTVLVALAANLVIAAAKTVGGLASGSPALLSEAAHSVADSLNEVFLLAALRRSRRPADARHPFGYGKERFFWALLAAVGIFVMGGCFSFYQGLSALRRDDHDESPEGYTAGLIVLGVAFVAESASLGIGLLLVYVAFRLGRDAREQLIGEAVDPELRRDLVGFLMRQSEIDNVAELLTMRLGMDSVLVAARIDLAPGIDSERIEEVSMRIREAMADRWPQADQVFLDVTNAPPRAGL
ncbi:cation diffusion facilitator family transporter [Streptomyces rubiginosohelvolus]|uniref:cation diffusion facilitator family transporter n=1 Tax=Streptomyces rubiginosohelvolus TaxID=67362 RepID=UPI0035DFB05C